MIMLITLNSQVVACGSRKVVILEVGVFVCKNALFLKNTKNKKKTKATTVVIILGFFFSEWENILGRSS